MFVSTLWTGEGTGSGLKHPYDQVVGRARQVEVECDLNLGLGVPRRAAMSLGDVTLLLDELANGNEDAAAKLMPLVYGEMQRLARRYMRHERPNHTLQATALVNEAYIKLFHGQPARWQDRAHFLGIAARVMRQILVDHARGHRRDKRGGGKDMVSLDDALVLAPGGSHEFLQLHESLLKLAELDPRQARVVELRFFGGLTVEEAAEVMGISPKTVKREWSVAKAWLHGDLKQSHVGHTKKLGND
jgi:RNA polymerase sigma-70 factor, ECF subfamily